MFLLIVFVCVAMFYSPYMEWEIFFPHLETNLIPDHSFSGRGKLKLFFHHLLI